MSFNGIVTESHDGVVDTAAEGGLIGPLALDKLLQHLRQVHGLQGKWIPKTSAAKGVGGQAKVLGVILLPLGIGGINGVLEATVVEGEVPLLLPVRLMRALHATISFLDNTFKIPEHNITIEMHELPSGHVTIPITNFENNRFEIPPKTLGCLPEEFHVQRFGEHHLLTSEAMGISQSSPPNSFSEKGLLANQAQCDGESSSKDEESRIQSRSVTDPTGGGFGCRAPPKESFEALASALQEVVGEWFPQLQPSPVLQEGSEPESLQDIYATLIQDAKVLSPLRGKSPPATSASSCIHPKARLKGGGNSDASYVTCQDCHMRWEIHVRASFLRKELKEEKKGGPLKL